MIVMELVRRNNMKCITKIRIPKGKYCGEICIAYRNKIECRLFEEYLDMDYKKIDGCYHFRLPQCLKDYPLGAVFELKEKK